MPDCCIVGGGVIGLSIARELARRGRSVSVVSRNTLRKSASWAAGGIFPAQPRDTITDRNGTPIERLTQYSDRLHEQWTKSLLEETGIDNGFRRCGSLAVATTEEAASQLQADEQKWKRLRVKHESLSPTDISDIEPALRGAVATRQVRRAFYLPDETQVRPPRHLAALRSACLTNGVEIFDSHHVRNFEFDSSRIVAINIEDRDSTLLPICADQFCIAAGAWSEQLLQKLDIKLPTKPWRGQILLHKVKPGMLRHIINFGSGFDYMIPRDDGHLLIGSTIEDVGFDSSTTPSALSRMNKLAYDLLPDVRAQEPISSWAGLRPGSPDGLPTVGRIPSADNAWLATGHYRSGFHLSTGTAHLISDSMCGSPTEMQLDLFSTDRAGLNGSAQPTK
ncbi:MAG: glycine oxidase ThiO [Planctomycetaceae bacterium]|jgi:glycine oxidase|nr:glycine oxidase ThiO [Planctomycetaceae bacterium]MBT4887393.1 glycine oxidase ThiO [Planctomycetaceae bacterium]MBT6918760.1 glycine oxidase ThiO [Planctomycetaceae bacterium]